VIVKHATADVFVFCGSEGTLRIGLVSHPLWRKWVTPGGHVESYENPAEAVLRELREETEIVDVCLLPPPGFALPAAFPAERLVALPWLITEHQIPADNGLREPHVHVDFQYVAVVDAAESPPPVVPEVCWFSETDLAALDLFDDARITMAAMFAHLREALA
jgi:8-oxo-dGTP pyrophosphatase MutT (NUDIX family)